MKMTEKYGPLETLKNWMNYTGLLEPAGHFWLIYRLRTIGVMLIIISVTTLSVMFIYTEPIGFTDKLESLLYAVATVHVIIKQLNIRLRQRRVNRLFEEIEELYYKPESTECTKIYKECAKKNRWILLFCLTSYPSYVILTMINMFVQLFLYGHANAPFQIWNPFGPELYMLPFVCFYQVLVITTTTVCEAVQNSIIFNIAFYIRANFQVLQIKLLEEKTPLDDNSKYLRPCFQFHIKILKLVNEFNTIFSGPLVLETAICSFQCCISAYQIVKIGRKETKTIIFTIIFFLTLIMPWMICISGNSITTQAEKLYRATYNTSWYKESIKYRKDLAIMITMASKPVLLNYRNVVTFDLQRYLVMLQAAYSYTTILQIMELK